MVKIDLNAPLLDVKGKPIKETADPASLDATLGTVALQALLGDYAGEAPTGEAKAKRFKTALKVAPGGCVEFSPEEIVELKKLIGLGYPPTIVGRSYEILGE